MRQRILCGARLVVLTIAAAMSVHAQPAPDWEQTRKQALELLLDRKYAEAIGLLEGAVRQAPTSADAHYELASANELAALELALSEPAATAERQKLLEAADTHFRRALDLSADPDLRLLLQMKLVSLYDADALNRPADAEPLARQLVAARPETPLWHEKLARVLLRLDRAADAARVLREARVKVLADERLRLATATTQLLIDFEQFSHADTRELTDAALAECDAAIAREPDERDHYLTRGAILQLQLNRLPLSPEERTALDAVATSNFDRFMALHPDRLSGQMTEAPPAPAAEPWAAALEAVEEAANAGRTADADTALAAAGSAHGAEPLFWRDLAMLENRRGRVDEAIAALVRWTELEPTNPESHHTLATFYWDASRDQQAAAARTRELARSGLAAVDRALALNPDYMEATVYRALLLDVLASVESDPARKASLVAEAEAARQKAADLRQKRASEIR
ncbi:MAG: tetratricopeptide repeat protein [Acidobacteria bacterium]|nr:tetratricopeptide repeat protein [Acidobacteriota bacterium]